MSSLFASETASDTASASASNSQKMPLLEAAVNIDPSPVKKDSTPSIESGNSLTTTAGPSGTAVDVNKDVPNSDQITIYTVHEGDTVASVAKLFNVSANTIRWANDLKPDSKIKKDDVLVILPISGIRHTVKKGETLKGIAAAYKGDLDEIIQFNNLPDNPKVAIGDVVIIPDGEAPADAPAKKTTSTKKTTTKIAVKTGTDSDTQSTQSDSTGNHMIDPAGYLVRPVASARRTQGLHGHNGVDLAGSIGTPIIAAAEGDVIISKTSGWNGGYGSYIVLSHSNGTQTLYAHLSDDEVSVGDHVTKGQTIGLMGESGKATGSHLHFEVRGGANPF